MQSNRPKPLNSVLSIAPSARQLLPAGPPQGPLPGPLSNGTTLLPRRKAHSTAACETCRKRKVKCNAARPACGYCVSASINCVYTTSSATETHAQALKRKLSETDSRNTTYSEIFHHLQARPESEVGEIVKRIKNGTEPEAILRYIREGDLLLQLALTPETRYRYVFPLVPEMPACLLQPENPYLSARVYEWVANGAQTPPELVRSSRSRSPETQSTYYKPYHAAELVDPLLDTVKPSEWTTVSTDNVLMRKMLANYFLHDYQSAPPFQKDYFLQDMIAGRHSCCSSLLVNSVLAVGSMTTKELLNRYEYWNPRNMTYQFLAEAKRLWEIESTGSRVRLTTIQAAILLHLINVINAMDAVGSSYTQHAVSLAQRIGLFSSSAAGQGSKRSNAKLFTAWALYNWQIRLSLSHLEPPPVTTPPICPLPEPSADPDWYGQIWLRYPMDPMLYTTHFPHQFKAQSGFSVLIIEGWSSMSRAGVTVNTPLPALMPSPRMESFYYSHMKRWYRNLPEPLKAANITLPSQLSLHISYHNLVYNLFEAVCTSTQGSPTSDPPQPQATEEMHMESPTQIRDTALRDFESLLRVYYLRHGYEHGDIHLGHGLAQLGFITLHRMDSSSPTGGSSTNGATTKTTTTGTTATTTPNINELRATLLLACKGLHEQGQNYFVDKAILRALKAKMGPVEQQLLAQIIVNTDEAEPEVAPQMKNVRSKVLPSAIAYTGDTEEHRLGHLVEKLALGDDDGSGDEREADQPPVREESVSTEGSL